LLGEHPVTRLGEIAHFGGLRGAAAENVHDLALAAAELALDI
jgi:hypothetical protein